MSLITTIPALAFPQELDVLTFSGTADATLNVELLIDATSILDVSVVYGSSGTVTLSGLTELIQSYVNDGVLHRLYVRADAQQVANVPVIGCRVNPDLGANDFCSSSFLSLLSCKKNTYPGAKEYVNLYLSASASLTVRRLWLASDETVVSDTLTMSLNTGLQTVDVSPMVREGMKLLSYEVRCGTRIMNFKVVHDTDCNVTSVLFHNSFGLPETFHFFGVVEQEVKPTRSSAIINGSFKNYYVETIPTWKATTSLGEEDNLLVDLVSSDYVERCSDHCPLALNGEEVKISNDRYEMTMASVTWRESSSTRRFTPKYKVKTFDDTFDDTFE